MSGEDRTNPPLQLMQVGGLDDSGEGSSGSGGSDVDVDRNADPFAAAEKILPTPQAIADAKEKVQQYMMEDPTLAKLPVATPNLAAYSQLDKTIAQKLLGGRKGAGNQPGKGTDGPGAGSGGTGADSTRARGLRWVMRFEYRDSRDYIAQLHSMGAEILVPLPPDNKTCILFRDLGNPQPVVATEADLNRLAGKLQWGNNIRSHVRDVVETLGVKSASPPTAFWAFFPKTLEDELAQKEKGYRNRRPEDIEETIYKVTIRGGRFEVVVVEQIIKK
jgi:hypothetical protein